MGFFGFLFKPTQEGHPQESPPHPPTPHVGLARLLFAPRWALCIPQLAATSALKGIPEVLHVAGGGLLSIPTQRIWAEMEGAFLRGYYPFRGGVKGNQKETTHFRGTFFELTPNSQTGNEESPTSEGPSTWVSSPYST